MGIPPAAGPAPRLPNPNPSEILMFVALGSLWLPILLGGVAVFFTSFVMRMVLKYHWSDYDRLPDEDRLMEAMREAGVKQASTRSRTAPTRRR